ncbi:MAG: NAD(+)/NADH kinase [Lachnospiraceae bacterium]|nr:NAD(+)/NADH kinase [Lachnospiraceae bacterium]
MKHFYLIENSRRGKLPGVRRLMEDYVKQHGADIICATDGETDEIPGSTDCLIVMGGDGTIMRAANITAGTSIPLIGINVGNLGYLTSVSSEDEIIPMLDQLLNDEYKIENHCMLKGTWTDDQGDHTAVSFNDINISRSASRAVGMRISVNGELLNEYLADGIIVSTPTGSTAYNLAAGGPIVDTAADVMILTPICPHAFMARSVVLGMDNAVEVQITGDSDEELPADVAFDGEIRGHLPAGTSVRITRANTVIPMIRLCGDTYFKTLRNKMNQIHG